MKNLNLKITVDKKNWRFKLPFFLGIFVLLNSIIWIILSGGRWFEPIPHGQNEMPEFVNDINRVFGPFYMLAYFTVQTNLFLGIMLIFLSYFSYSNRIKQWFVCSIMLISVTFFVYWTILAPTADKENWNNLYPIISSVFLHAVNPILGFLVIYKFKNEIVIDKTIVGKCSLYMSIFCVFASFFYSVGAIVKNSKIEGAVIYNFLNFRKPFFIDLSNFPVVALFFDILILMLSPFVLILFNWIWIKLFSFETTENSYFKWMEKLKIKIKNR